MRKLLLAAAAATGFTLATSASALNILVTNDDGCEAPGIKAVQAALAAAGHQVTVVAPRNDNSGIGAAANVSPGQAFKLTTTTYANGAVATCVGAPDGWASGPGRNAVVGSPVDSLIVGLDVVLKNSPPDLVVSGTNFGQNNSVGMNGSGTVGAATKALARGVPAIAISTAIDLALISQDQQAGYLKTVAAMDDSANLLVKVIAQGEAVYRDAQRVCAKSKGKAWPHCSLNVLGLPAGHGLNINYPAAEAAQVKGVKVAPVGRWADIDFKAQQLPDGTVISNFATPPAPPADEKKNDAYLLTQGYAVISVMDGNLGENGLVQLAAEAIYRKLTP